MIGTAIALLSLLLGFQAPIRLPGANVRIDLPAIDALGERGSISGRTTLDATGEPVSGLLVEFLSQHYSEDAVLVTSVAGWAATDDKGEYSVSLPSSARYYVRTAATAGGGEVYLPLFYPGTPDETTAAALDLSPGQEIRNVDFFVSRGKTVAIRGTLIDGLGRRLPHLDWVSMSSRVFNTPVNSSTKTQFRNSGPFEIPNVLPGSYYLRAYRLDDVENRAETVIPVEVRNADLEGVEVISLESHDVTGRIRFEPERPSLSGQSFRITLSPVDERSVVITNRATIRPDGVFNFIPLPTGVFRLSVMGVPPPFYVKSARNRQVDVLTNGLVLDGADSYSVEIVLAGNGGQISGVVVDADENPIQRTSAVALIPEVQPILRPDLYKIVNTDGAGRFTIAGIAPGNYQLYAWEVLPQGAHFDPGFMNRFVNLAKPIRVTASSSSDVLLEQIDIH